MEKVIAYKSSNGRLFDTEEKCVAYEKKMSKYPYSKDKCVIQIYDKMDNTPLNIFYHETIHYASPSDRKIDKFFNVCDKYRFYVSIPGNIHISENGLWDVKNDYESDFTENSIKHLMKMVLRGENLTTEKLKETRCYAEYGWYGYSGGRVFHLSAKEEKNGWLISIEGWEEKGQFPPCFLRIERI